MKQKLIGDVLYVFKEEAYEINVPEGTEVIFVPEDSLVAFETLNPLLTLNPYNYDTIHSVEQEWEQYRDRGPADHFILTYADGCEQYINEEYRYNSVRNNEITQLLAPDDNKFFYDGTEIPKYTVEYTGGTASFADLNWLNLDTQVEDDTVTTVTLTLTPISSTLTVDGDATQGIIIHNANDWSTTYSSGDTIPPTTMLYILAASGYTFDQTSVTSDRKIELIISGAEWRFEPWNDPIQYFMVMGQQDATVTTVISAYNISYSGDTSYVDGPSSGAAGATITLTPTTAAQFADITLTSSDATITKNADNWTFTMPEGDVAISVAYNPDYSSHYFTVRGEDDMTVEINSNWSSVLEMSSDGNYWTSIPQMFNLSPDETVQLRLSSGQTAPTSQPLFSSITGDFSVEGNIMSLCNGESFLTDDTTISQANQFVSLFGGCSGLISAEHLVLPATTLADYCYSGMFYGCTSLTTAPVLPATTLADYCYQSMFSGCTSLTAAPALPATTLADYCYGGMFSGCTSLTSAPALHVTTLAEGCYSGMFTSCTSLTTAPILYATTLAEHCYEYMFASCTSLATAPALPATTLINECYHSMFQACTSLTTAPELPATTLADECYHSMFDGCTSLNYIKCLATDISAMSCTMEWVQNVASEGTFVKDASMNDWQMGSIDGIPEYWQVEDAPI